MRANSMPNIRHLRAVSAVARLQSVNRAASELFVTQPAVSQAIAGVEDWCARQLFVRHRGGMLPTPAGSKLIDRVNRAIGELERGYWSARPDSLSADHFYQISSVQFVALASLSKTRDWESSSAMLGVSSTSLKRTIRTLELTIGCMLLHRTSTGILFTEAGTRFAASIGLAIRELELGTDEIAIQSGARGGTLRIGSMPLARAQLIPQAVMMTLRSYPDLEIIIADGAYDDLRQQLRSGEIDLMVGALRKQHREDEFDSEGLIELPLSIVARSGHPLFRRGRVSMEDTVDYRWIVSRDGSPARRLFERMFEVRGMQQPANILEVGCQITSRNLLLNSDMLALLSAHQIELERVTGQLSVLDIELEETRRTIGVSTRKQWAPTEPQRTFLSALKSASFSAAMPKDARVIGFNAQRRNGMPQRFNTSNL